MKPREIEKIIKKDGWFFKNQRGSHRQYIHLNRKGKVTIPYHNKDLDLKTVKSILKQAGIK